MNIKKILFVGDFKDNSGPSNVNKKLKNCFTSEFRIIGDGNRYIRVLKAIFKVLFSQIVVVSGVTRMGCFCVKTAKALRKKTVYIMHGCDEYEQKLNGVTETSDGVRFERFLMENADVLLPVSKTFMNWVKERYPKYANKTNYIFNGIDVPTKEFKNIPKQPRSIAVSGGDMPRKNNIPVVKAVEGMGESITLTVFGAIEHSGIKESSSVVCKGALENDVFLRQLAEKEIFILNSLFESFSLAAAEALMLGCSVLISQHAGILDILELEESDIIFDPNDESEIARKIKYLFENPNNRRIVDKLQLDEYSWESSVKRLKTICAELV